MASNEKCSISGQSGAQSKLQSDPVTVPSNELDDHHKLASTSDNELLDDHEKALPSDDENELSQTTPQQKTVVELETSLACCNKEHVKIVVVGPTGSGKSSLINKLLGQDLATIDHTAAPCQQAYVEEYQLKFSNVTVHIYDTRGLGDPNVDTTKILKEMSNELEEIDLLLVCHKLYNKVDDFTYEMMRKIKAHFGSQIFDHTVIFLTQADEYIVHCKSHRQKQGLEEVRREFQERIDSVKSKFQHAIVERHRLITEDQFAKIPFSVSSYYDTELPTTSDWIKNSWDDMLQQCTPDCISILSFIARNKNRMKIVASLGATSGIAAVLAGATVGGLIGTGVIVLPGVGTVAGIVIGSATAGAIYGGLLSGGVVLANRKR